MFLAREQYQLGFHEGRKHGGDCGEFVRSYFRAMLAREGIELDVSGARMVGECEIDVAEEQSPIDLTGVNVFSSPNVGKILMVRPHNKQVF